MNQLLKLQDNTTLEYHTIKVHKYRVDYKKYWGTQQRNLVGSVRGNLVGISANITVTTDYLDQNGVEELGSLLNQSYFSVQYFDTLSNEVKTALYTASDTSTEIVRLVNREYRAISFTLTAVDMWVS